MQESALIIGAGDGLGAACSRRFAAGGLIACPSRRDAAKLAPLVAAIEGAGGKARPYGVDAGDEAAVAAMIAAVERDAGPISAAICNPSFMLVKPFAGLTAGDMEAAWRTQALGFFNMARAVAPGMASRGRGTIILTGGTGSMRGGNGFAAFAQAKFAARAMAQSLAREYGPQGVHVAHVVIDGIIDVPRTRERMPERIAEMAARDGALTPDAIADTYWHLHTQPRTAWTHEVDLRPWSEKW